jgi:hypothetical protein
VLAQDGVVYADSSTLCGFLDLAWFDISIDLRVLLAAVGFIRNPNPDLRRSNKMAPRKTVKKSSSRGRAASTTTKTKKKTSSRGTTKKTTTRNVKKVNKPASKRGGATREMDPVTGFAVGTDSQYIAEALMEGGETRQDIIDWLKDNLETETRNGTEKPVANLVAGVHNKLIARGFTVEGSFRLVPPKSSAKSRSRR